jgi:hypothetical protein
MIDKAKLEDSFLQIGTDRIPAYIDLYLASNKKFITLFDKYIARRQLEKLTNLVHKTKGSTAVFYDEELDEILIKIEGKLLQNALSSGSEEISIMKTRFKEFWSELISLKEYYSKQIKHKL